MRMHQTLPFFMEKKGKKWPLFLGKLCFLASAKQLKTSQTLSPRVLDAKKHVVWGHRLPKYNLQHANYLNGCLFYIAAFWIFGRHKILCERVVDASMPVAGGAVVAGGQGRW